jgi:hypothetical protein
MRRKGLSEARIDSDGRPDIAKVHVSPRGQPETTDGRAAMVVGATCLYLNKSRHGTWKGATPISKWQ